MIVVLELNLLLIELNEHPVFRGLNPLSAYPAISTGNSNVAKSAYPAISDSMCFSSFSDELIPFTPHLST